MTQSERVVKQIQVTRQQRIGSHGRPENKEDEEDKTTNSTRVRKSPIDSHVNDNIFFFFFCSATAALGVASNTCQMTSSCSSSMVNWNRSSLHLFYLFPRFLRFLLEIIEFNFSFNFLWNSHSPVLVLT